GIFQDFHFFSPVYEFLLRHKYYTLLTTNIYRFFRYVAVRINITATLSMVWMIENSANVHTVPGFGS
ncbi:MAG: hypothetical protein M1593_03000, partial [Candidatus Thermoplasmatota archaeon]|nr:hypothetical protein [Candidatus Thermoplasmatota archaeon]